MKDKKRYFEILESLNTIYWAMNLSSNLDLH